MTKTIKKIGLIQTAPLPGDFSTNLRTIVQGYRECLDHGADLVIAPAAALCGLEPRHLSTRRSFLAQTKAALDSLSRELGSAPLLLAAYAKTLRDEELYVGIVGEDDEEDPWMAEEQIVSLVPHLLEKDSVTELENSGCVDVLGSRIYTDTSDEEILPNDVYDFMVRMPTTPWYATAAKDEEEARNWEASMAGCVVICSRSVGSVGGNIYGGGSAVYSTEGKTLQRLAFFEPDTKVVNISSKPLARHLPDPEELLAGALQRGIRDNVRHNGFTGVCIPLDHPNSALLGVLCVEALGASNVCGISYDEGEDLAKSLGISCFKPHFENLAEAASAALGGEESSALRERIRTVLAITHAESRGMMLCSALGRREIMLGEFSMYGTSGGHIAPVGNLYDVDIYLLSEHYKEKYNDVFGSLEAPSNGATNRIIHELADMNTSPSALLHEEKNYLFKENDVRIIQRKLLASALKRSQLPIVLHADAPSEQLHFPVTHRLND